MIIIVQNNSNPGRSITLQPSSYDNLQAFYLTLAVTRTMLGDSLTIRDMQNPYRQCTIFPWSNQRDELLDFYDLIPLPF